MPWSYRSSAPAARTSTCVATTPSWSVTFAVAVLFSSTKMFCSVVVVNPGAVTFKWYSAGEKIVKSILAYVVGRRAQLYAGCGVFDLRLGIRNRRARLIAHGAGQIPIHRLRKSDS